MLVEVLSDHPREQLRRADADHEDQLRRVEQHRAAVNQLRADHAASRRWWQIRTRLTQRKELHALQMRAPVIDAGIDRRRAQQAAGISAEDQMTAALRSLPDDRRLFRGYANRRGEVDHLLVGPGGVWAIEVKRRRVRVHIDGDNWWFEKFDRYGNLVDQGTLSDRTGRSWGRQVTEIARELERFLASRRHPVTVRTAVVLMHDGGELGSHRNLQVDLVSVGSDHLLERLHNEPRMLDRSTRGAVANYVRRDHAFHAGKAARRRSRS